MQHICPVCKIRLVKAPNDLFEKDVTAFSCYKCGDFSLSHELIEELPSIMRKTNNADIKLSHALRIMQGKSKNIELLTGNVDIILEKPLPRP